MAKKEAPPAAASDEKPASKSKLKVIILVVIGLLLAMGLSIGGTLFFLNKGDKPTVEDQAEETIAEAVPVKQPALYEQMEPAFVVNFNKDGRQRYMQVKVALMGRDQAEMDALKVHMPVLRNQLVMLFSSQDFAVLATPLGKELLQQQATAKVQELAQKETGKAVIERVLFTNFVLQ